MSQTILFCDCRLKANDTVIRDIVRDLTGDRESLSNEANTVQWHITTKYYEANVTIDIKRHSDLVGIAVKDFSYPAVILLSEGKDNEMVDDLWKRLCDGLCDVRLLATTESDVRPDIQDWCLRNEFELIELGHECSVGDDALNDEIWGWRRIKSALEARDWCNLVSMDSPAGGGGGDDDYVDEETSIDQFEQLLEQLGDIKDKLEGASADERIRLAEEVTLRFWRSMGGSDSELNDDA